MEDLTGKQLGSYQIVAPLGEGGMAAVYKAYQPAMDRYVALKVLPRHFASDPQFVARFQQEAKVLAKLQHPHILPVHDFGEADGYTYLVMPFVESGTLTGLMQGQPLPLLQIRTLISQVGDALDYAHARGLVHRDVKPGNILVDERGNCLLTDFGIAKIIEGTIKFTTTGGVVGTPAYMSPEQGLGQKLDGRTDIYSLGVILYEMATGRPPYAAETPMAVVIKHINDPLPPPRTVNPTLPESVERVILKALTKNPDDRYATAGEMVRALQAAIPDTMQIADAAATEKRAAPQAETLEHRKPEKPVLSFRRRTTAIRASIFVVGGLVVLAVVSSLFAILGGGGTSWFNLANQVPTQTVAISVTRPVHTASPGATGAPTQTPFPTQTPTLSATFTATPRADVIVKQSGALLYVGPSNLGYETTATQLSEGMRVMPLGVYGDFIKVRVEMDQTTQEGYILGRLLDHLPDDLPNLTTEQVPWITVEKFYTSDAPRSDGAGSNYIQHLIPKSSFQISQDVQIDLKLAVKTYPNPNASSGLLIFGNKGQGNAERALAIVHQYEEWRLVYFYKDAQGADKTQEVSLADFSHAPDIEMSLRIASDGRIVQFMAADHRKVLELADSLFQLASRNNLELGVQIAPYSILEVSKLFVLVPPTGQYVERTASTSVPATSAPDAETQYVRAVVRFHNLPDARYGRLVSVHPLRAVKVGITESLRGLSSLN